MTPVTSPLPAGRITPVQLRTNLRSCGHTTDGVLRSVSESKHQDSQMRGTVGRDVRQCYATTTGNLFSAVHFRFSDHSEKLVILE